MSGERMRLIAWTPLRKNSLIGFVSIELPIGLQIHDCPVLLTNGRYWAAMPAKAQLDAEGRQRRDDHGKARWAPVMVWRSARLRNAFSERVVELVRQHYPDTLETTERD